MDFMKSLLALLLVFSLPALAGELKLGKPLTQKESITVDKLMGSPDKYVNKTVQVKGKITEVCQQMGCWMMLVDADGAKAVRIKVNDGEIEFPKNASGKIAVAEGKFTKKELTKEQAISAAKHEAEEQKKEFDASKITSGKTVYQIQGTGAVITQ